MMMTVMMVRADGPDARARLDAPRRASRASSARIVLARAAASEGRRRTLTVVDAETHATRLAKDTALQETRFETTQIATPDGVRAKNRLNTERERAASARYLAARPPRPLDAIDDAPRARIQPCTHSRALLTARAAFEPGRLW